MFLLLESYNMQESYNMVLFCQPRVEVTSCFVYKVMGLNFHDGINTQIYDLSIRVSSSGSEEDY